jgi:hypothetical protein
VLTPQGLSEKAALMTRFLGRKMQEYEALKAEIKALKSEAGTQKRSTTRKVQA